MKKKKDLICFPHADEHMQFQIPDVNYMFYFLWMCVQREGAGMERSLGRLMDCCTGQEALQMQHRKKKNDSWQSLSEPRSAVKRKCNVWGRPGPSYRQPISRGFVQLSYSIGIPAQLCENICSLACYMNHLETNWKKQKSKEWNNTELWIWRELADCRMFICV